MNHQQKIDLLQEKQVIIGIDIAKHVHYASIVEKKTGRIIKTNIKISNSRNGFESFGKVIKKWKRDTVIIGMEPTGHYWKVINHWLVENGYRTVLVNPYHVKLSKELHDNLNNKNDKKDSQIIAKIVSDGGFLGVLTIEKAYDELRQFSLIRDRLVKDLGREKVRLKGLFDEFIPEYCHCFKDPALKTSLTLLEKFSLQKLTKNRQINHKITLINKVSRGAISREKAANIVKILSNSIGIKHGINGAEYKLQLIIKKMKFYKEEIETVTKKLEIYLKQVPEAEYMFSMKGLGIVTVSGFLGQTGCLQKFSHPNQLQKFAGMTPVQHQSGKFKGKTKLSKRGNSKLRSVLYKIAVSLISNNAEMKKFYRHKINTHKKKKLVALTSVAAKALKILFKLGRNKLVYDQKFITIT